MAADARSWHARVCTAKYRNRVARRRFRMTDLRQCRLPQQRVCVHGLQSQCFHVGSLEESRARALGFSILIDPAMDASRAKTQDYCAMAGYIDAARWETLRRVDVNHDVKRHLIMDLAIKLGLVNVSEPTYAHLVAIYLLCIEKYEVAISLPFEQKLVLVRLMRTEIKRKTKGHRQVVGNLPIDPLEFQSKEPDRWGAAYKHGPPVPHMWPTELAATESTIRVRGMRERSCSLMPFQMQTPHGAHHGLLEIIGKFLAQNFLPQLSNMAQTSQDAQYGSPRSQEPNITFMTPPRHLPLDLASDAGIAAVATPSVAITPCTPSARSSTTDVTLAIRKAYEQREERKGGKHDDKRTTSESDAEAEDPKKDACKTVSRKKKPEKKAGPEKKDLKKLKKKAELVLGCSKCRYAKMGCGACRDPSFGGARGAPPKGKAKKVLKKH